MKTKFKSMLARRGLSASVLLLLGTSLRGEVVPILDKVPCAIPDLQAAQVPDRVQLTGLLGLRIRSNAVNRLLAVDVVLGKS